MLQVVIIDSLLGILPKGRGVIASGNFFHPTLNSYYFVWYNLITEEKPHTLAGDRTRALPLTGQALYHLCYQGR